MPHTANARAAGLAPSRWQSRWLGLVLGVAIAVAPALPLRAETAPGTPAAEPPAAPAEPPAAPAEPPAAPATGETTEHVWTADALDTLTARIALYPDALIAQVLPAATLTLQVVEAARWLADKKSVADGDKQDWDPSVKALLRYPTVLRLMSSDLRWTDELGQAFLAQPQDVLQSIQRMRRKARALGNLQTTPRQRVIVDPDSTIVIAPPEAEPDVIYVPVYDPNMVYFEPPPPSGMWISFDVGFPLGVWIGTGVSWSTWHLVYGGWGYDWGWGDIYGGCCRGAVYPYVPTAFNRRLTTDNRHFWRPPPQAERRRLPSFRSPAPPRPTPNDISRGRMPPGAVPPRPETRVPPRTPGTVTPRPETRVPPRTPGTVAPRPETRVPPRTPGFTDIQRRSTTDRNAERGRESLGRTTPPTGSQLKTPTPTTGPQFRTPTPPARFTPPAARTPSAPTPNYRVPPRTVTPSPSFTPRSQPDTQRFQSRGQESRTVIQPRAPTPAPRIQAPTPAPRIQAPAPAPRVAPAPAPRPAAPPARGTEKKK